MGNWLYGTLKMTTSTGMEKIEIGNWLFEEMTVVKWGNAYENGEMTK